MDLDFLEIHALVTRFKAVPDSDIAIRALQLMDRYHSVHPYTAQLIAHVRTESRPDGAAYTLEWARAVENSPPDDSFFREDAGTAGHDKAALFAQFLPLFRALFVRADFHMLGYYINKLEYLAPFASHPTDHEAFVDNRLFEFLFYQIVAHVYGQVWFGSAAPAEKKPAQETPQPSFLAQTTARCDAYNMRCAWVRRSAAEKPPSVAHAAAAEFDYACLVQWYVALLQFKEAEFSTFVSQFDTLEPDLQLLHRVHLHDEALVLYGLACVACRPFNLLELRGRDVLLEQYNVSQGGDLALVYRAMCELSRGEFGAAKTTLARVVHRGGAYLLPHLWDFFMPALASVVDCKAFLLTMSVTRAIPRAKMLGFLGYASNAFEVSHRLVLLVAALGLGEQVGYDQARDIFFRERVSRTSRMHSLYESVEEVAHLIAVESSAKMFTALILQAHLTQESLGAKTLR